VSVAESDALPARIRALTAAYYRAPWGEPAPFQRKFAAPISASRTACS
jgi:hypothetical protein